MVVDAMDLAYAKQHMDTLRAGLGRLRLLAAGLQAAGERQVRDRARGEVVLLRPAGRATATSSSSTRTSSANPGRPTAPAAGCPEKKAEAFAQLIEAILALQRENKDTLWGSMVKQTMIRKNPAFNETYYGYSTFSKLLEEAAEAEDPHSRARREERHLHNYLPRGGPRRLASAGRSAVMRGGRFFAPRARPSCLTSGLPHLRVSRIVNSPLKLPYGAAVEPDAFDR